MKHKLLSIVLIGVLYLLSASTVIAKDLAKGYPQTDRTKLTLTQGWMYKMGGVDDKNYKKNLDDSDWEEVTIPHTLKLTSINLDGVMDDKLQKTFHREVGWYRRDIKVSKDAERVVLDFEGAHQITTLWVNGKQVGIHKVGGYTPFFFDISDYVKRGASNQITLLVDNRVSTITPPDPGPFDYIKFSGLYRDVYLVETNSMYITPNIESMNSGVTITTPSVDYVNGNATIDIRTEVRNETGKAQKSIIVQRVVDADGEVVLKMSQEAMVAAGATHRFVQTGGIEDNVKFWSTDDPYLYKVNTTLYDGEGRAIDVVDNRLGLRKIEYDHETGFRVNGKSIEIIGMNRHQHYGFIGDAMPNSLHYKDMIQIKNWGFNCVRTAHYPQDDEIIKACDELGLLVYEEAPTWISISNEQEWYTNEQEAARRMIRNHKNSPSIFIWGAGINHRGAVPEMQFLVKQEDPTRLTASQSSRWTGWQNSSWTDIFANMNYGPGIWNREEPLFAMEGGYGPDVIATYKRDPQMPGMISWTAHAYYTFHDIGDFVDRTRSGAMDSFRYPKNSKLSWYPAEMKITPYLHIVDQWTPELTTLNVYSNATSIELELNGKVVGKYSPSKALKYKGLDHPPYEITGLPYEEGELKLTAYREGEVIMTKSIFTPESARGLRLVVDKYNRDFIADGNDILVVHAEVIDRNGTQLRDHKGEIKFAVKGDATVVGDGTDIRSNPVNVKMGKGTALIRAGVNPGTVTITASAEGLKSASTTVSTIEAEFNKMVADSYEIKDYETLHVDMGAKGQLLQFGWTPWIITDNSNKAQLFVKPVTLSDLVAGDTPAGSHMAMPNAEKQEGDYTFTISATSANGVIRSLGEMNVIGKNGFVYGDGLLMLDKSGSKLSIEGLPAGEYKLMSYHHAPSSNTNDMDPNLERLKSERLHTLPYSKNIEISVNGEVAKSNVVVSAGKEQQLTDATTATVCFTIENDGDKVEILYRSTDNNSGVWFNGFELKRAL